MKKEEMVFKLTEMNSDGKESDLKLMDKYYIGWKRKSGVVTQGEEVSLVKRTVKDI